MPRTYQSPPDLNTPGGRLRWARETWAAKNLHPLSMRAAAAHFGWPQNTYKAHEQGKRGAEGLKESTAKKYAKAFGVRVEWLMTGLGSPVKPSVDDEWAKKTAEERDLALRLLEAAKGRR